VGILTEMTSKDMKDKDHLGDPNLERIMSTIIVLHAIRYEVFFGFSFLRINLMRCCHRSAKHSFD
jgi:hypothetical protein